MLAGTANKSLTRLVAGGAQHSAQRSGAAIANRHSWAAGVELVFDPFDLTQIEGAHQAELARGVPHADPDDIAQLYRDLHTRRDRPEHLITG
jgi:hypothetical protein